MRIFHEINTFEETQTVEKAAFTHSCQLFYSGNFLSGYIFS